MGNCISSVSLTLSSINQKQVQNVLCIDILATGLFQNDFFLCIYTVFEYCLHIIVYITLHSVCTARCSNTVHTYIVTIYFEKDL